MSHTTTLLRAMAQGAAIRERLSNQPAVYAPRTLYDGRPWVAHDDGLGQDFRLSGADCMAIEDLHTEWRDGLSCPKCGTHDIHLSVRQWASCNQCKWADMEFALTGYGDGSPGVKEWAEQ